jgi:hypothetical protein
MGRCAGGRSFVVGISAQPLVLTLAFAIGGVVLAWRMKEPLGRIAMLVFAIHHGILAYTSTRGLRLDSFAMTTSITGMSRSMLKFAGGPGDITTPTFS